MKRISMAGVAAWLLAAGCASNQIGSFQEEAVVREIQERGPSPMEVRVALAPLKLAYEPSPEDGAAGGAFSVELDRRGIAAIQEELEGALGQEGLFEEILILPDVPGQDCFQAAWDRRVDLLMEVKITGYRTSYCETTGWYIPNVIVWGYLWLPSWWVADERYRAEVEATVTLTSVHTGQKVWEETYTAGVERELDDWERGWILAGIFRVPGALQRENWERIDGVVGPFAVRQLAVQLFQDLHEGFREYQRGPEFSRGMTKTLALVVGVTKYRTRKIRNVGYADRDAEGLRQVLCDPKIGGIIPQNVLLLVDEQATREGILDALDSFLARRAEYPDSVIVYYAGNGGSWGKRPYLLPWDFDPDHPDETALDLAAIRERMDGISCTNLVTILDCSFLGAEDGRCFPLPGLTGEEISRKSIEGLASEELRRWVLLGALPDQAANEQDSVQSGIFSHFLLEALRGRADGDGDGAVHLLEVYEYLQGRVDRQSEVSTGRDQNPKLIPEPSGDDEGLRRFRLTRPVPGR